MNLYDIREKLKVKSIYEIPLRVTYYARVSTDKYEQKNSLENQVGFFKEMIKNNPYWTFIDGYIDEGISGTSTKKRDSFLQMIEDGKARKFDLILTKEISRFARDTLDSIENTRILLSHNVGVQFLSDNINTLLPDSELRLTIMASLAQEEVRKLSERCKFGFQRSIKNGRVLGNNDIWGYKKNNCKLEIVPEEAPMIKRIFELYSYDKYGCRTIANMLFKEGFKNKNGNALAMTTIINIIRNPKYKGYYCGNKTTVVDYKIKKVVKKDKEDWVIFKAPNIIPPIISEELWDEVNRIYQRRSNLKSDINKKGYQNRYHLSGKIKCNKHNKRFHRKKYTYKTKDDEIVWLCPCNNGSKNEKCKTPVLYEKKLLKILKSVLYEFINNRKSITYNLLTLYHDNFLVRDYEGNINKLKNDINKIKREKDKLLKFNLDDVINDEEFKERNDICNVNIDKIKLQINDLKKEQQKSLSLESEIRRLESIIENKMKNPSEEIIYDLLDKIVVSTTEIPGLVKLNIFLNVGQKIEVNYINSKSHHFNSSYSYDKS